MEQLPKTVAIVGLGYVGLPLACLCAGKKYKTYAIDVDQKKIELIEKGISPIKDKKLEEDIKKLWRNGGDNNSKIIFKRVKKYLKEAIKFLKAE